jgi:hypothetical protein
MSVFLGGKEQCLEENKLRQSTPRTILTFEPRRYGGRVTGACSNTFSFSSDDDTRWIVDAAFTLAFLVIAVSSLTSQSTVLALLCARTLGAIVCWAIVCCAPPTEEGCWEARVG